MLRFLTTHDEHVYFAVAALAVALPGVEPVTTVMELLPLLVLFEGSIWASVLLERR